MHKVRIQFSKGGALRFVGHLDFLRVFQQALRRSGLPVAYSQGFNPHILLSFALPLPLGMESVNDYADLVFEKPVNDKDAAECLQRHVPSGLIIKKMWEAEGRNAASLTAAADYTLKGEITTDLLAAKEWIIPKKTKSGIKDTDIRPDIFDIKKAGDTITLSLAASSGRFVNPLSVAGIVLGREVAASEVVRAELYEKIGERFIALDKYK
jgi:radical SAM-linked protein